MTMQAAQMLGPATTGPLGLRMDLIALREARGWSTRDLAREAGVVHETVRRTERGKIPRPRVQFALATALGGEPTVIVPTGARYWSAR